MNIWDIYYMIAMPVGWATSILDTLKIIKYRSAKARSVSAYGLALLLLSATFFRALLSIHDLLFWLNAAMIICLNVFQFACIWKWRRQ